MGEGSFIVNAPKAHKGASEFVFEFTYKEYKNILEALIGCLEECRSMKIEPDFFCLNMMAVRKLFEETCDDLFSNSVFDLSKGHPAFFKIYGIDALILRRWSGRKKSLLLEVYFSNPSFCPGESIEAQRCHEVCSKCNKGWISKDIDKTTRVNEVAFCNKLESLEGMKVPPPTDCPYLTEHIVSCQINPY